MPSTYSTSLRIELQADGENAGVWGQKVDNDFNLLEQSIAGWATIAISGNIVLTALNGLSDQARNAVLNLTNGGVAAPFTVTVPAHSKVYSFDNQSGQTATITGGGTTFAIPTGRRRAVYVDTSGNVAEYVNDVSTLAGLTGAAFTGIVAMSAAAFNEAAASIASAATTNIGAAAANYLTVTGTTSITAFDTVQAGTQRTLAFAGALTLTYNATSLILPGAVNITTAAGDTAIFRSEGAGNWRCIEYMPAISYWSTGDVKATFKAAADNGWVMMNDGTVGDTSSGGTTRANADTAALFTLLWTNTANADCAVSTGRGVSAAADFAAHKTIALPKMLGRALAGAGAGSGLTSRALAHVLGEETHTLTAAEQATMPLSFNSGGTPVTSAGAGVSTTIGAGSGLDATGQATGGGGAHNNMQPTMFANFMIKL